MTSYEDRDDQLERLIGLRMDGRLDAESERELDERLASSPVARETEQSLLEIRRALRAEVAPHAPGDLAERTLLRVGEARARAGRVAVLLPLARRLAVAAAVLFCASLFLWSGALDGAHDQGVGAAPPDGLDVPTIEDEIQPRIDDEGSFVDYLAWRFLGQDR